MKIIIKIFKIKSPPTLPPTYTRKGTYRKILINVIQKNLSNYNKIQMRCLFNNPPLKNIIIIIKIMIRKIIINNKTNGNRFKKIICKITKPKFLNKTVFYLEKIVAAMIQPVQILPKIYLIIMKGVVFRINNNNNNNFTSISINLFQNKILIFCQIIIW